MATPNYDWIVVGGGLTGAALSYELARQGQTVALVEPQDPLQGATRYSYGGIAHWSGTDLSTRQWCDRAQIRYGQLPTELESDIQHRTVDLLLTVEPDADPPSVLAHYQGFTQAPRWLSPSEAVALEPELNGDAIGGALAFAHGHVCPLALVQAYGQGFQRWGGVVHRCRYTGLRRSPRPTPIPAPVTGIDTDRGVIAGQRVVICAGGVGRSLLRHAGFPLPLYYTQAEVIEIQHSSPLVRGVVMPAANDRGRLESHASQPHLDRRWDQPGQELVPPSLDLGAVQFRNGRLLLGQTSRTWSDLQPPIDAAASAQAIRQGMAHLFPNLAGLPGTWHQCLVAFSRDGLPLVGEVDPGLGLYLFTGFSSPFVFVPPMAQVFAAAIATDPWDTSPLAPLHPRRFSPD